MKTQALSARVAIKVPFHDVDPAGVVWHGNYFRYFELARCELLESLNYSYYQMRDSGYLWPVVDLSARFTRPITFEQEIVVVATLKEWEYRLKIHYQIYDSDQQALGRGETVQVPIALPDRELVLGSPQVLLDAVAQAMDLASDQDSDQDSDQNLSSHANDVADDGASDPTNPPASGSRDD